MEKKKEEKSLPIDSTRNQKQENTCDLYIVYLFEYLLDNFKIIVFKLSFEINFDFNPRRDIVYPPSRVSIISN